LAVLYLVFDPAYRWTFDPVLVAKKLLLLNGTVSVMVSAVTAPTTSFGLQPSAATSRSA
jgi:hypothetical protein